MDKTSYMLAIPAAKEELVDAAALERQLREDGRLQVLTEQMEDEAWKLELVYNNTLYHAKIYPCGFELPELYRVQHFFPDVDIKRLETLTDGLAVELSFMEDALASYHLQLIMISAMLPDVLAVLDDSAEKILSGHWVRLAASSNVPPAPRYLYTVQAVSDEGTEVWLHTHGLNRCGLTELEILDSSQEHYQNHYSVIETMANRLLELDEEFEMREPLYIARLKEDAILVATLLPWREAVLLYDDSLLGSAADRVEGHDTDTSCIFVYPTEEDYENGRIAPVSIFDELLGENLMYMVTQRETDRMKALAIERVGYIKQAAGEEGKTVLVKLGLDVDEEHRTEENNREHIWFELLQIDDLKLRAKLTQEPYYISGLHEGYVGEYPLDRITDWLIFTADRRISPDDAYLMDL